MLLFGIIRHTWGYWGLLFLCKLHVFFWVRIFASFFQENIILVIYCIINVILKRFQLAYYAYKEYKGFIFSYGKNQNAFWFGALDSHSNVLKRLVKGVVFYCE